MAPITFRNSRKLISVICRSGNSVNVDSVNASTSASFALIGFVKFFAAKISFYGVAVAPTFVRKKPLSCVS